MTTNIVNRRIIMTPVLQTGGSSWTPASLGAALVGWYKADVGVFNDAGITPATNGQQVAQWNDQSGNGNHLSGTTKPVYNTTGFNGGPTIVFTTASAQWLEKTVMPIGNISTSSAFIAGIVTSSTGTPAQIICYNNFFSWLRVGLTTTAITGRDNSGVVTGVTIVNGANMRLGAVWDGVNYTAYLNNVAGTPVASTITITTNQALTIGAGAGGSAPFDGSISELVLTNSGLSGTDLNNLDSYFRTKWGL
jgi:hypothetical protein